MGVCVSLPFSSLEAYRWNSIPRSLPASMTKRFGS